MLEALATSLQDSALSQTLRGSLWLYPIVNLAHVLGIALLFGGIAPLDLRLIGCWPTVPLAPLARVLVPTAMAGLALAVCSGVLLFVTRPVDYVAEPLFLLKFAALAAAVINALWLRRQPGWTLTQLAADAPVRPAWRRAGLLSLLLWLTVIAAGRLIGYR